MNLIEYIQQRADAGEFEKLVEEMTDLLYVGFEAGGVPGNLPQFGDLTHNEKPIVPAYAVEREWLVIPDRATLLKSITAILDQQL